MRQLSLAELQADEIQTIVAGKDRPIWIFVVLDVWSRLWPSTVVGKRSYRNTLGLFRDVSNRRILQSVPLITTDGFKFYERAIGRVFGPAWVYGQLIKTLRNDRVARVERKALVGALFSSGTYALPAKKSGFFDVVIPEGPLDVNQSSNIDATMTLGKFVQQVQVNVSASAVVVETQSSMVGA